MKIRHQFHLLTKQKTINCQLVESQKHEDHQIDALSGKLDEEKDVHFPKKHALLGYLHCNLTEEQLPFAQGSISILICETQILIGYRMTALDTCHLYSNFQILI